MDEREKQQAPVAWMWRMNGWIVSINGKHRGIKTYVDLCRPPNSVIESDDFIELLPVYTAIPTQPTAQQNPVAWVNNKGEIISNSAIIKICNGWTPLYNTSPTIEAAVLAEREACAKVCADMYLAAQKSGDDEETCGRMTALAFAEQAIRARGEK